MQATMPWWTAQHQSTLRESCRMTTGGVLLLLFLLACGALAVATLVVAGRGGRGPADPPRSHPVAPGSWPTPAR
jgi:hypothetical protein